MTNPGEYFGKQTACERETKKGAQTAKALTIKGRISYTFSAPIDAESSP